MNIRSFCLLEEGCPIFTTCSSHKDSSTTSARTRTSVSFVWYWFKWWLSDTFYWNKMKWNYSTWWHFMSHYGHLSVISKGPCHLIWLIECKTRTFNSWSEPSSHYGHFKIFSELCRYQEGSSGMTHTSPAAG